MTVTAMRSPSAEEVSRSTSIKLREEEMYERTRRIRDRFPSVDHLNWDHAFARDVDLFGRMIRDILKLDQSIPGQPGPRPEPDPERSMSLLRRLAGTDFCLLPFAEAFGALAGTQPATALASLVGLAESRVRRLRAGAVAPTLDEVVLVATAFGKHPSFFFEYRVAYVMAAISRRMETAPEASVGLYRKLAGQLPG